MRDVDFPIRRDLVGEGDRQSVRLTAGKLSRYDRQHDKGIRSKKKTAVPQKVPAEAKARKITGTVLKIVNGKPTDEKLSAEKAFSTLEQARAQVLYAEKHGSREEKRLVQNAEIGVLLTFQPPTQPMKSEAASAGFYESPGWKKQYPKLQILTIAELRSGIQIDMPPLGDPEVGAKFKKAARAESPKESHPELDL